MAKDSLTDEERFELEKQKQARLAKFKMDKHHKIERFGVTVAAITFCLLTLTVLMFVKYRQDTKRMIGDTPMYSTGFTMSLTGNSGHVENIYRNEKGDKVAILVKFDSMEGMKTDAKNYQAWVTGYDAYYPDNISGGIYVYGKSGYMALCFYSPTGFSNQVLDIIVRSNESIVAAYVNEKTPTDDSSFSQFDQFRIYANLGARKMNVASFFDTEDGSLIDSRKLYDEAILLPEVKNLKAECNDTLADMEVSLRRMDYLEETLTGQGIQILDRDSRIKGDKVVKYTGPVVTDAETKVMNNGQLVTGQVVGNNGSGKDTVESEQVLIEGDSSYTYQEEGASESGNQNANNTQATTETYATSTDSSEYDGLWKLESDYTFEGGLDLDWQSYDLFDTENHLLDKVRGDEEGYAYLNLMDNTIANATDRTFTYPEKWVRKDGSEFEYNESVYSREGDDDIQSNIESLKNCYSAYFEAKTRYQTILLPRFLRYEYDENNFAVKTNVNVEKDCIQVWQKYSK